MSRFVKPIEEGIMGEGDETGEIEMEVQLLGKPCSFFVRCHSWTTKDDFVCFNDADGQTTGIIPIRLIEVVLKRGTVILN